MTEKTTVAIFGAAGSMGTRSSNALKNDSIYHVLYVEAGEKAMARLRERGVEPTEQSVALKQAEVIVLAVPDALIATVAAEIVPEMQSGAMLIGLDPAAPHAGRLPGRQDVSYFFSHPSHPPIFNDETEAEARRDFFWRCGQAVDRQRPIAGAGRRLCQGRGDLQQALRADSAFAPDQHRADGDFGAGAFRDGDGDLFDGDPRGAGRGGQEGRAGRGGAGFPFGPSQRRIGDPLRRDRLGVVGRGQGGGRRRDAGYFSARLEESL